LELEDFPSKVRIVEEKLGVAREESNLGIEAKIPNRNVMTTKKFDQVLGTDRQFEATGSKKWKPWCS
jgi:hypothetical protein